MAWWFSAAKQVLDDLHQILTRQSSADKSHLYNASLCGPWRCGPWKSDATWLSRFIHCFYETEGTILHRYRNWVDKHLIDCRDDLRFDIFLLQCWSEMALDSEHKSTFEIIYSINDESPEICTEVNQLVHGQDSPQLTRRTVRTAGRQRPVDRPLGRRLGPLARAPAATGPVSTASCSRNTPCICLQNLNLTLRRPTC